MPSERGLADAVAVCVALALVVGPVATVGGLASPPAATDEPSSTAAGTNATVTDLRVWSSAPPPHPELSDEWPLHEAFDSRADVETAMADGRLRRDRQVPTNGTLVLELRMPGMAYRLANASGANETARFLDVVYGADDTFRLEAATNPGPMVPISVLRFNRTGAATVYVDRETDTYYVVVDPTRLLHGSVRPHEETRVDWQADRNLSRALDTLGPYALNVTVDGRSSRFFGNASVFDIAAEGEDWERLKPVVAFTDDGAGTVFELPEGWDRTVRAQPGQRLVAATSLDAGAPVTVRVVNRSDGRPPLSNTTAATDEFGSEPTDSAYDAELGNYTALTTATATLDTSGVVPNSSATLEVVADGRVLLRERFTVRPARTTPTETAATTPTATSSPTPAETGTTTSAVTPTGTPTPTSTVTPVVPDSATDTTTGAGPGFGLLGTVVGLVVVWWRRRERHTEGRGLRWPAGQE